MTAKLNQIIALEKGIKAKSYGALTELHKTNQHPEIFNGFYKSYTPKNDQDETLPPESKRVQYTTRDILRVAERSMSDLMEITARKDWTNCNATASVTIDGKAVLENVPITYLLFLEKQLTDFRTFIANLPVLDASEDWAMDENSGLYKSKEVQTHRTKKVQKPLVLYPATDKHPAQTQLVTEDIIAGFWSTVKHSGAMPKPEKEALFDRIEKLLRATKEAREEANGINEVEAPDVASAVFGWLAPEKKGEE